MLRCYSYTEIQLFQNYCSPYHSNDKSIDKHRQRQIVFKKKGRETAFSFILRNELIRCIFRFFKHLLPGLYQCHSQRQPQIGIESLENKVQALDLALSAY